VVFSATSDGVVPTTLPVLAENTTKHAALKAGDWLAQIEPLVSDVSAHAGFWWEKLLEATEWLQAAALQRLYISPPADADMPRSFDRLRQRCFGCNSKPNQGPQ